MHEKVYKYSHTQNVSDAGVKKSKYGNNWNNSNIRGTDRTSAVNQAHVLTFSGSSSLKVTVTFG